jgi:puromycin-sensitive aminopeptidase
VQWYEWYFGVPYFGGRKIDHIAIPEFEAGAMENTSCVTYREERILCNEATASHAELESIAETILHESGHFWFGDLVTMLWWNGLWLNESFATFMENLCLSFWKPEYRIWDTFGLSRAGAMKIDGLKSTHPIEVAINHPDEVDEIFDAISYEKGGSVLDMLHQFIGFEVFRKGIQIYLKRHALSNTETNDLWDAVAKSCRRAKLDVPVSKMMSAWIFTPGHPVISAKEGDEPGSIAISQQQFRYLPDVISTTLWPVPIIYQVKAADGCVSVHKVILNDPSLTLNLPVDYQWIKLNAGGSGFFRVRYDQKLVAKLTANVQENLSAIERFNLVGDAWACVQAGLTSSVDFLQMVPLFAGETNPNVMTILLSALSDLHRITPEDKQESLKNIITGFLNPTFDKLGWAPQAGESIQTTELRASILMTLGTIGGDQTVRAKAVEIFDEWLADKATLDPNLLGKVVAILAYWGDAERYQQFYGLWRAATTPNEEGIFLFALAKFRDAELLGKTLTLSMSGDVSDQDAPDLFSGLLSNKFSQTFAWQYLRDNWEKVKAAFPVNMVPRIARSCSALDNEVQSAEVRAFFAVHELKAGAMAIAQMLEQLDIAVRFRQSETGRLAEYLK